MMGFVFNGFGKYVGWSNLFDYSSVETINASEYLPLPNRTRFKDGGSVEDPSKNKGINIDKFVIRLNEAVDNNAKRIKIYADLLNELNEKGIPNEKGEVFIYWTVETQEDILGTLYKHEFTKIPKQMLDSVFKNFVSSHILNTIQHFTNMISAYTPIEMRDTREAANKSPKGEQSKKMTLMNPLTKYLMQYANMTGRNVIGIAANGIKGAFTWAYYLNEITQNNYNNKNEELIKRAKFEFTTNRIYGRSKATNESFLLDPNYDGTKTLITLPELCWEKLSDETKELILSEGEIDEKRLINALTVDLLQSQVMSAATDNAKELILAKINAGSKLAKYYLFLITLGFNINDIVAFMTSPVVEFIDTVTEPNMYLRDSLSIDKAIDLLEEGKIPYSLIYTYFDSKHKLGKKDFGEINEAFKLGTLDNIKNPYEDKLGKTQFISFINKLKQLRNIVPEDIKEKWESKENKELTNSEKDLLDFKKVTLGANEFTNFSKLLKINKGIKGVEREFRQYLAFIKNIIAERENSLKLGSMNEELLVAEGYDPSLVGKFDINKWLEDEEYRKIIAKYYSEKLKVCIPIFDIIENIPQFKNSFEVVDSVNTINNEISIINKVEDLILKHYSQNNYWSDYFRNNLIGSIRAKLIQLFLYNSEIQLPYLKGTKFINNDYEEIEAPENGLLKFDSSSSLMSFKYVFENLIIPKLKDGKYVDFENGEYIEKTDDSLKSNPIILDLIEGDDRDLPLYRLNIDMLYYDQTAEGLIKFENYIRGLKELLTIYVNNIPLSDWFILYNLYVNRNNYGSNRLTTLFSTFIDRNNANNSIINKYLDYVGKIDYEGKVEWEEKNRAKYINVSGINDFSIDVKDLFMMSANTVQYRSLFKSDPVYKLATETGVIYFERHEGLNGRYSYSSIDNQYFNGTTSEELINKQNIINSYNTVGGLNQEYKLRLLSLLESIITKKLDVALSELKIVLQELQANNFLQIYKECE